MNELVINNKINIDEWENVFQDLYRRTSDILESTRDIREDIHLSKEDIEKELKSLKNRKFPWP
jgi:hypothetical protein